MLIKILIKYFVGASYADIVKHGSKLMDDPEGESYMLLCRALSLPVVNLTSLERHIDTLEAAGLNIEMLKKDIASNRACSEPLPEPIHSRPSEVQPGLDREVARRRLPQYVWHAVLARKETGHATIMQPRASNTTGVCSSVAAGGEEEPVILGSVQSRADDAHGGAVGGDSVILRGGEEGATMLPLPLQPQQSRAIKSAENGESRVPSIQQLAPPAQPSMQYSMQHPTFGMPAVPQQHQRQRPRDEDHKDPSIFFPKAPGAAGPAAFQPNTPGLVDDPGACTRVCFASLVEMLQQLDTAATISHTAVTSRLVPPQNPCQSSLLHRSRAAAAAGGQTGNCGVPRFVTLDGAVHHMSVQSTVRPPVLMRFESKAFKAGGVQPSATWTAPLAPIIPSSPNQPSVQYFSSFTSPHAPSASTVSSAPVSPEVRGAPVWGGQPVEWSCAVCTYRHTGAEAGYLVCEMCRHVRPD